MNNVVVIRCGENSLHHAWLTTGWDSRDFDLVLSFFSEKAFHEHPSIAGIKKVLVKGGKWDGIYETVRIHPEILNYEYVWLPDDDIGCSVEDINRIFFFMKKYNLNICQPSLSYDSYFSHAITLRCRLFILRYVDFVEIMVPCFKSDILKLAIPLFKSTMSGFGLDYIICRLDENNKYRNAILDSVPVTHTRPKGSVLAKSISSSGRTNKDELRVIVKKYGINLRTKSAYAAISIFGLFLKSKRIIEFVSVFSWLTARRKLKLRNKNVTFQVKEWLKNHGRYGPEFTKIKVS